MKNTVLVLLAAAVGASVGSLWQSGERPNVTDLRAKSLTLYSEEGTEVKIAATKDGFSIASPLSTARVDVVFMNKTMNLNLTAQDTVLGLSVGNHASVDLVNKSPEGGGIAGIWAGPYGGAGSFQSKANGQAISLDTQGLDFAALSLRRLNSDYPVLRLELTKTEPRIKQIKKQ